MRRTRRTILTHGKVALVQKGGDNVSIFQVALRGIRISIPNIGGTEHVQVIMGAEYVSRDGRSKVGAELIIVCAVICCHGYSRCKCKCIRSYVLVGNVNHSFRMSITKVTWVWEAKMNLVFVKRVFNLVGVNAC